MKTIVLFAKVIAIFIFALFILRFVASAQQPPQPDMTIDVSVRSSVIQGLVRELNDSYVFADVAKKMEEMLKAKEAAKEYDTVTSARAFAEKLTADLQSVSKDKHLRVRFSAQPIPVRTERGQPTPEEIDRQQAMMRRANYGFNRIERLDGNIGYIQFDVFADHEKGADTIAAAMAFLANTEAIIFDLRQNGGGNPFMVALISTYLFGDKPVHLNSLYWRRGDRTDEFWTKPELAKVRFPNKDVYILTANRTFSGAEEFSYNLKNLKRATIIGETTGGGAHPGGMVRLHDHFGVFIPTGRAINPISKTNWEGTGVEPDIKVPKEQALKVAHIMAITKLHDNEKNPETKAAIKRIIDQTQKELNEMKQVAKAN